MPLSFENKMNRIYEATGTRTQAALARVLGIKQPAIHQAVKRQAIPSVWYVKLMRLGVNMRWIDTGQSEVMRGDM